MPATRGSSAGWSGRPARSTWSSFPTGASRCRGRSRRQDQIRLVQGYLDARRDLTARLEVVAAAVPPGDRQRGDHGLAGGPERGRGPGHDRGRDPGPDPGVPAPDPRRAGRDGLDASGQPVFTSDVFRALMPTEDLGYISVLQVKPDTPVYHFPPIGPGGRVQGRRRAAVRAVAVRRVGPAGRLRAGLRRRRRRSAGQDHVRSRHERR